MKRYPIIIATVVGAAVLGTGCTTTVRDAEFPTCRSVRIDSLVLVAQSVPTAQRVPCVSLYPAGWKQGSVEVRSGHTRFSLDSDAGGSNALEVTFEASCDVAGATQVPSDEPGTVRYDRIPTGESGLHVVRTYQFAGGCVNYRFDMSHATPALVDEATLAVSFLGRSEIRARAEALKQGRTK